MASVAEDRIKGWVREEVEKKAYSLQTIQEIMKEVFRSLSSEIVPIEKQEIIERISTFDDINSWISTCKNFEKYLDALGNLSLQ